MVNRTTCCIALQDIRYKWRYKARWSRSTQQPWPKPSHGGQTAWRRCPWARHFPPEPNRRTAQWAAAERQSWSAHGVASSLGWIWSGLSWWQTESKTVSQEFVLELYVTGSLCLSWNWTKQDRIQFLLFSSTFQEQRVCSSLCWRALLHLTGVVLLIKARCCAGVGTQSETSLKCAAGP